MEVGFSGETLLLVLAGGWVARGIPYYSQGIWVRQKTDLSLNPKALVDSVGTHSFCLEGTSCEAGCRYHDLQSLEAFSGNTLSFSRCLSRNIPSGIHWSQNILLISFGCFHHRTGWKTRGHAVSLVHVCRRMSWGVFWASLRIITREVYRNNIVKGSIPEVPFRWNQK